MSHLTTLDSFTNHNTAMPGPQPQHKGTVYGDDENAPKPGLGPPVLTYLLTSSANVNLVPLLWTGVPTPSAPADRQDPLPIFRCPGNASTLRRVFPDHLISCSAKTKQTAKSWRNPLRLHPSRHR